MTRSLSHLIAKRGEKILPKWKKLLKWARFAKLIPGPGVQLRITPDGTHVHADVRGYYPTAFQVSGRGMINGQAVVRISPGTVNGLPVRIGGVTLDGLDLEGNQTTAPVLAFDPEFNERGQSWVIIKPESAGAVYVADHTAELVGDVQPVAMLQWTKDKVSRIHQITRLNLNHGYGFFTAI